MPGITMGTLPTPNVLADRYASPEMVQIWDPSNKVRLERQLWIAVMRGQADLGLPISDTAIADYEGVVDQVNLGSIRERETVTKHDVKARIEEFNALAGHESIHQGMTSRDLTETVEQLQVRDSLLLVRDRTVPILARMAHHAIENADLAMVGRSHNVPAQLVTLGKRMANYGEETIQGFDEIDHIIQGYALRGIKGPVGTQQDMLDLFNGDAGKVDELEQRIATHLGFDKVLGSVGQVYPRSLDSKVVSGLHYWSAGPTNMALGIRHMAGLDLVTEGFREGQVGSSAMPHKMNTRSSERITGFGIILGGYVAMANALSGSQWNEGDVSCSVVRRVMLPDAFYAADGLGETTIAVLDGFGAYPAVIDQEITKYAPFVATTKILIGLLKAGMGREAAHGAIKKHAVALAREMRASSTVPKPLFDRLGDDDTIPLAASEIRQLADKPLELVGLAPQQAHAFGARIDRIVEAYPLAAQYASRDIL